jgi:perosamine synthetase
VTPRRIQIAAPATGEEEWLALREPLESGWLSQGSKVAEFERRFADRHGVQQALATTSCTTALHLALVAIGLGPGDEVIVPSFTWVATANAVVYCGATPVLADVDPLTFNLDPSSVQERLTPRTRAVIAVHLFGLCADVDAIREVLPHDVVIVEDAACAAAAAYGERPAGSLGEIACFSFHPRKSITTGEGGMVTTNDPELAARVQVLRNHGASIAEEDRHASARPWVLPEFDVVGFNYRMTDLQAAIGIVQLAKLDDFVKERQKRADFYRETLADVAWLRTPMVPRGYAHAWQAFVCTVDPTSSPVSRDELLELLDQRGIAARPGTHAVHDLSYYRRTFGYEPHHLPVSHACSLNTIAIPLHNRMSDADFEYVAEAMHDIR